MTPFIQYDHEALARACEDLDLPLVVAFGSRVSEDPPPADESDLDIAVLDAQPFSWERWREVYGRLSSVFGSVEVDLALLRDAEPLFRFEIFRTAVPLFGDLDLFAAQKAYAYKAYMDSADLRRLERLLFKKKMAFISREIDAQD